MSRNLFSVALSLSLVCFITSCTSGDKDAGATGAKPGAKEIYLSQEGKFTLDTIAKGLKIPFGLDWLPDGRIIFTERGRRDSSISLMDSTGKITPLCNVPPVDNAGQGGMLDVLVHPDYKNNGWIYYSYSFRKPDSTTATIVERAKIENNCLTNIQRIYETYPYFKSSNHYGSRMLIRDGYIFITNGERATAPDSAQLLTNTFGKIIRLHEDGKVPTDNPFVNKKGARPEIWSYGHRNPQGLAFRPGTDELWESEHGPQGGDEANIIKPGKNYGWPIITYGEKYGGGKMGTGITMKEGMEQPMYFYRPSIGPSGMTFYDGDAFPGWKGSVFIGSLAYQHLNRLVIKGTGGMDTVANEERILTGPKWRIRVVKQGPDGLLYVGVDNDGMLIRLRPYKD